MTEQLPTTCLRGIRKAKWVIDGIVLTEAFQPERSSPRNDKGQEVSVNWEDDERAVEFTLSQHSIAQAGFARISRMVLDDSPLADDGIVWERRTIDGNDYHGNIVYPANMKPFRMKQIASFLAVHAKFEPRRPTE